VSVGSGRHMGVDFEGAGKMGGVLVTCAFRHLLDRDSLRQPLHRIEHQQLFQPAFGAAAKPLMPVVAQALRGETKIPRQHRNPITGRSPALYPIVDGIQTTSHSLHSLSSVRRPSVNEAYLSKELEASASPLWGIARRERLRFLAVRRIVTYFTRCGSRVANPPDGSSSRLVQANGIMSVHRFRSSRQRRSSSRQSWRTFVLLSTQAMSFWLAALCSLTKFRSEF
jgi:hypothetical protein